jgi:glycerol kinase
MRAGYCALHRPGPPRDRRCSIMTGRCVAAPIPIFTQHCPKPGWVEHDAEEIALVTFRVVAEAIRGAEIRASDIQAIGITNQRETVLGTVAGLRARAER